MLNCRPGDLAVIFRSPQSPANVGKIVRVIRPAVEGEWIEGWRVCLNKGYPAWIVESNGSLLTWSSFKVNGKKGQTNLVRQRAYADYCLKPIRDPGDDAVDQFARKIEDCV
jgi:hypothetical protein